jgi:hypothetical protein
VAADKLEAGFRHPPAEARPWVYWFPLDGNITSNGITLDLEAMARAGIGGVLYMETDQGAPKGPADFGGPRWRALFQHICAEARRLGLEVNMNNDAGWCGSGGPWITPALSMQQVVWTETNLAGPRHFEGPLTEPKRVKDYYEDIAVFAYPAPAKRYVIPRLSGKSAARREEIALRAAYPPLAPDAVVPRDKVLDLTAHCAGGKLAWDVPPGSWRILRLGHTSTGKDNHPAPSGGRGLECDKLSAAGADAAFAGLMSRLIADSKALVGQRKTLVSTHIDSWEVGSQNWTPKFREEFQRRRGYDPLPWLPVMVGQVLDSLELSERFLWDVRMTVNDLLLENYAGRFRELARRNGIRLSIEAYDGAPCDDLAYGGRADEPMGEFWSWDRFGAAYSCTEMASAAHVYGRRIIGAEAFTANDQERWRGHPGNLKDLGDWAFCEGINRFVFHRYALQPWADARPGMSMGPWGLHYERTQTWWEQSRAWHEYLARCQFLLRQGRFVADLCFLSPETSPFRFKSPARTSLDRPGYNFDACPPELVLDGMKVENGRLALPSGMSYRALVLPQVPTMTPQLLRKIKQLLLDGATVVGAPPLKAPGLTDFPKCDEEVTVLARELWGDGPAPATLTERRVGRGRLFWGGEFSPANPSAAPEENPLATAQWIWFPEAGNPAESAPPGKRFFRRVFEVDAVTGVASARLTMTADNTFECAINGQPALSGNEWARAYRKDIKSLLQPGHNLLTVAAVNTTDQPNPAGLIASLTIKYEDGRTAELVTDASWQAAREAPADWQKDAHATAGWTGVQALGPFGMDPWGEIQAEGPAFELPPPIPDIQPLCRWLESLGVPADFSFRARRDPRGLRYIHRTLEDADIYFVANKNREAEQALCSFRVTGRPPELWWPETGRIERPAVFDEAGGVTRLPLQLDSFGSVFVLFRKGNFAPRDRIVSVERDGQVVLSAAPDAEWPATNSAPADELFSFDRGKSGRVELATRQPGRYDWRTADGRTGSLRVGDLPPPIQVAGPWEVRFAPNLGAPARVTFDRLISWSEHTDPGVKYFSGAATYSATLDVPKPLLAAGRRLILDLGKLAVMAEVRLNGKDLGILWKAPFRLDVTAAAKPGKNQLEVRVVNLWINRQIGDEQLPEDSDRNQDGTLKSWPEWLAAGKPSPAGRYSFTSWRLWKKDDRLVESGLLGPVTLGCVQTTKARP